MELGILSFPGLKTYRSLGSLMSLKIIDLFCTIWYAAATLWSCLETPFQERVEGGRWESE